MAKTGIPRNPKIYLCLLILFVLLVAIMPKTGKFNYDYKKGSPWTYETLISEIEFPILKTPEQLQAEKDAAGSRVVPCYRLSEDVLLKIIEDFSGLRISDNPALWSSVQEAILDVYDKGVMADEASASEENLSSVNPVIFIQKDKRAVKCPATDIYTLSGAKAAVLSRVKREFPGRPVDSLLTASGVFDIFAPNLIYDKETTDLVHAESVDFISPTRGYVNAGQLIVTKGEIVTAEIAQMLDSYKAEFEDNLGSGTPKFVFWVGNALLAFMMVFLFFIVVYFLNPALFTQLNKFTYLQFIFLFTVLMTLAVNKFAPRFLYMAPFALAALYLEAFFKNKMIMPFCCVAFMPLLIFASNGVVLFVMFIIASQVAVLSFKYFNHGWQQFIMAGLVFLSLVVTYFAFRLVDMVDDNPYIAVLCLAVGSLLTVAGYTLIFLFERLFNLLSLSRLAELCDTNNPLLREFESKAPGSFQHSLQVMNMADVAARTINANVALVRAGALYHDIGKMNNPLCFIENESLSTSGTSYHAGLSPMESAQSIIRHVSDGIRIARERKLPDQVVDFIRTHHGTSCAGYFYSKYINAGGDPAAASAFFYNGVKPQTKEQVIVMICDTLEAASRTLKDNSPETFDRFVEEMVAMKLKAGQFDNAEISIHELEVVKEGLKSYLSQLYHERIVYPGQKQ